MICGQKSYMTPQATNRIQGWAAAVAEAWPLLRKSYRAWRQICPIATRYTLASKNTCFLLLSDLKINFKMIFIWKQPLTWYNYKTLGEDVSFKKLFHQTILSYSLGRHICPQLPRLGLIFLCVCAEVSLPLADNTTRKVQLPW